MFSSTSNIHIYNAYNLENSNITSYIVCSLLCRELHDCSSRHKCKPNECSKLHSKVLKTCIEFFVFKPCYSRTVAYFFPYMVIVQHLWVNLRLHWYKDNSIVIEDEQDEDLTSVMATHVESCFNSSSMEKKYRNYVRKKNKYVYKHRKLQWNLVALLSK